MLFIKFITEEFYNQVRQEYPLAARDRSVLRFIMYLALPTAVDSYSNQILLSQSICASLEGKNKELIGNRYCAKDFLERAKEIVPSFRYLDYVIQTQCRMVLTTGFSKEFQEKIEAARSEILKSPKGELVHYATKGKFNIQRHKAELEKDDEQFVALNISQCNNTVDLQDKFINYFNSLATTSFTRLINKNWDETIATFNSFQFENSETKDRQFNILNAIKLQPKPYYFPVIGSRRLFAAGGAITYLKRELRKVLTKGWIEIDITNCHLAIIAKDWNIKALSDVLSEGSIWKHLDQYIDGASTTHKPELKKAIYGLVYGDSKKNIGERIKKGSRCNNKFWQIPVIQRIYEAREVALSGALFRPTDCFGTKIEHAEPKNYIQDGHLVRDRRPHRHVLSVKASAVELKMLEPIIDFSEKNRDYFAVTLYQFDGVSVVSCNSARTDAKCKELKALLDSHIKQMGYITSVEYSTN